MRISTLLKREPFGIILERTLKEFFQDFYGQTYNIKWRRKRFFTSTYKKGQVWLCNPYINAIFVPQVNQEILAPVIQEFSRSIKLWQTPFQKTYVILAANQLTSRWLSTASIEVNPPLNNAKKLLIIGGNNHIRLLDYSSNCTYVIHKSGFNKEFFLNDIKVRMENTYLPTPRIKNISKNKSWYSESLILGTPINRLGNKAKAKNAVEAITSSLFKLLRETSEEIDVEDYVTEIAQRIENHIKENRLLKVNAIEDLQQTLNNLLKIIKVLLQKGPKKIVTAQTHGDFHAANILIEKDHFWLIDWEYSSRRQIAYDALVYSLASRFPRDLNKRIDHALKGVSSDCEFLMSKWPMIEWQNKIQRQIIIVLFLLEELELKLKENINSEFKSLGYGFKSFYQELKISIQLLQRITS